MQPGLHAGPVEGKADAGPMFVYNIESIQAEERVSIHFIGWPIKRLNCPYAVSELLRYRLQLLSLHPFPVRLICEYREL
jgi:hypothetical protein